jgi:small nuclear ribonucleoprotein D3
MTGRDGRVTKMENVFLRGGQIKFIVLPEMLKNAPIFKKVMQMRAKAGGVEASVQRKKPVAKKGAR